MAKLGCGVGQEFQHFLTGWQWLTNSPLDLRCLEFARPNECNSKGIEDVRIWALDVLAWLETSTPTNNHSEQFKTKALVKSLETLDQELLIRTFLMHWFLKRAQWSRFSLQESGSRWRLWCSYCFAHSGSCGCTGVFCLSLALFGDWEFSRKKVRWLFEYFLNILFSFCAGF